MSKNETKYSIEDAQSICLEALKPLGEDYLNHFRKVFDKASKMKGIAGENFLFFDTSTLTMVTKYVLISLRLIKEAQNYGCRTGKNQKIVPRIR